MELIKEHWNKDDIEPFLDYLKSFSKGKEKANWEQRIVNTKLACLAVPSTTTYDIIKQIFKGNYIEFLNLNINNYLTNVIINGQLIGKIKDFNTMQNYLVKFTDNVDNWAATDSVKFKITESNKNDFLMLAKKFINSKQTFTRRMALIICLKLTNFEDLILDILTICNSLESETEYYVNMANAWLIAECFTKHRALTLELLNNNNLNKFTINKAISKCRDSFRVSPEDKEMLLKFKK